MCALIFGFVIFGLIPFLIGLGMLQSDIGGIQIAGAIVALISGGIMWVTGSFIKNDIDYIAGKRPHQ